MRINRKLKTTLFSLATLLCAGAVALGTSGLNAQDLKVAVLEPTGEDDVKTYFKLAMDAFASTVSKTSGFQVMTRNRADLAQIRGEHEHSRDHLLDSEARDMGKQLGVDFIFTSEVSRHDGDDIHISCKLLDIVTGQVLGPETETLEFPSSKQIVQSCQDLMERLLKNVNKNAPRDPSKVREELFPGLDGEITKAIMNNRSNPKWNTNRRNYSLEVDLSSVTLSENREFGRAVYKVGGYVAVMLTDDKNGNGSDTEVKVDQFTEMSKELLRNKLLEQIKSKSANIIRDLLDGLSD